MGTVVQHATADYIGVVVGYDDVCRRTDEWCMLTLILTLNLTLTLTLTSAWLRVS